MRPALVLLALLFLWPAPARTQESANPLFDAVSAYGGLQDDMSALGVAGINRAGDMDAALERAARHAPRETARGFVAYGALIASQSPAFAAGVRSRVRAANHGAVLRQLARDPNYARRRPPGSDEAVRLILASARADAARLAVLSTAYQQRGHALQTEAWAHEGSSRAARETLLRDAGRQSWPAPAELLARLRPAPVSAPILTDPSAFGGVRFWGETPADETPWRLNPSRAETIDHMLTLGALHILGATATPAQRADDLLNDDETAQCLQLALLQFRQCASVTQSTYEDAFCLALHGLEEPAQCFASLAIAP